ncbi:acyl-CoA dehydrogenase family protein [Gilvimarinus sp. F26214L]|uniref:acyl-CoA dehydrogenase family protein n=1 Tax=Gilvimarinus sp. DZF01 TaxID=3461371 RepID=UPI0040463B42
MNLSASKLAHLREITEEIVEKEIAPLAERVDRDCLWPSHSMRALARAGLTGLHVPEGAGGQGQGLLALSMLTETIGRVCPSSALCFGMHCVGTAVIAAKATPAQQKKYLEPIAAGEHITTLALSEKGSGAYLYLPATEMQVDGERLIVRGNKQFVTNGGHADSYVVSAVAVEEAHGPGDFSCLVVDGDTPGLEWQDSWRGFGMRGNSSRGVNFLDATVPLENFLGEVGDQVWYVFEVIAPYFLMAMAGTYLGIADAAYTATRDHLRSRHHSHSGVALAEHEVLQHRLAEMWTEVEKTRSFLRSAAQRGDLGEADALPFILGSKAEAGKVAVNTANEAMTLCGGMAYGDNSRIAQMLRDARASHVMSPTTDLLRLWTGRALLDLPLL